MAYRSTDGTTYFDHQDTLGTERMRTNYAGAVGSSYKSLPWGDGYTATINSSGADQDNNHFAGLERDAESGTEHAEFRNYASLQGRWLAPDPYMGSYDLTNPQTMNRYTYALNNPVSAVDPSGMDDCVVSIDQNCQATGGGGGEGCDPFWRDCGGCDPIFEDCGGGGPSEPGGGWYGGGETSQAGNGPLHLEPNWGKDPGSFGESLGFPAAQPKASWGIAAALGLPGGPGCDFGACGDISSSFTNAATAPLTWCAEHPTICTAGTDLEVFLRSIPTVAASVTLLSMEGDNHADPNRCQKIISAAQAECVEELYGGNSNGHGQAGPTLFRKCVRQKIVDRGVVTNDRKQGSGSRNRA